MSSTAYNTTKVDEGISILHIELASKQQETLNEVIFMQQNVPDAVVVFSNTSDIVPQSLSFVAPRTLIANNVQVLLDITLVRQKEETQAMVYKTLEN